MSKSMLETCEQLLSIGDLRAANKHLQVLMEQHSDASEVWALQTKVAMEQKMYEQSFEALERFAQIAVSEVEHCLLRAWYARKRGMLQEAHDWENRAMDHVQGPEDQRRILLSEAETFFAEASTEIQRLVDGWADQEEISERMDVPDEVVDVFRDGLEALDEILEGAPVDLEALSLQADFYSMMNQLERAVQVRAVILEHDSERARDVHAQADDLRRLEQFEQASYWYAHLYGLELTAIAQAETEYGLCFDPAFFQERCVAVWQELLDDLEDEGLEGDLALHFVFFPVSERLEDQDLDEPFDPWSAFFLDFEEEDEEPQRSEIPVILYQRNVERIWRRMGEIELDDLLREILEEVSAPPLFVFEGELD
ncbi:MAG: hypothetical protein AAGJ35_08965 [Myxococcota bacterium]